MEKENNSNESDFSENEIPDLNYLNPFKFEPKANIGDIISSSSDDDDDDDEEEEEEEDGPEYKLKWIVTMSGASADLQPAGVRPATLLKKDSNTGVFL